MNKLFVYIFVLFGIKLLAQSSSSPAPYCNGSYSSGQCSQPGPSNSPGNGVNDFINSFNTTGATTNISNNNSGCNSNPNNYILYCNQYLVVSPGQTITCNIQSGITFAQGFVIYVDWDQDNAFANPGEQVAATSNVPAAATWTTLTFVIPPNTANGAYRMRVRCAFSTAGTAITPCGTFGFGETEDYTIYVGGIPPNAGVVTATATSNGTLCSGQTISLSVVASGTAAITYTWTGPASYSSTSQNPFIGNATSLMSGVYTVQTSGACPATETVNVLIAPDASFSISPAAPSICQGNNSQLGVVFLNPVSVNQFTYSWAANPNPGTFVTGSQGIISPNSQNTMLAPGMIGGTQAVIIYSATVSPTVLSCPVTQTVALTINNPVTPTLNMPSPLCNSFNTLQLTATPGGGTWTSPIPNFVSQSGVLNPSAITANFGNQTLTYSVSAGNCIVNNSNTVSVSKFNTPALTSTVNWLCVQDPTFNLMSIVQTTETGVWSGTGVSGSNGSYIFTPSNTPSSNYGMVSYPLTYSTVSVPDPAVCPASTILAMPVFNPPIPTINPIPVKCNNTGTIQLTANPTGSPLWTGNNAISSTGVYNPALISNGGVQTVTYTAGQGTCVASNSATFLLVEFRTAALTGTVPNLCVTNNPFNLMTIVQDNHGQWTGTGGRVVNTGAGLYYFDPGNPIPSNLTTYTLYYNNPSAPVATLCPDTRSLVASVLNPPAPSIVPAGPYCSMDGTVQLVVTPKTGAWVSSPYIDVNGVFTPSLSPIGSNIVQYVIGTSTCNAQQTIAVSVEAFVTASIIPSQLPEQCITNAPLSLLPMTLNNSGIWFGAGIQGSGFNPAIAGTGQHALTYSTSSSPSGLCPDQQTVAVNVYSLALPAIKSANAVCNSSPPFEIGVSPIGGLFGGANTDAISPTGLFNPAQGKIGKNVINYSVTAGPCVAYSQTTINVEQFVSADFAMHVGPFCQGEHKLFNMNSAVLNPGGTWQGVAMFGNIFNTDEALIDEVNKIIYTTHSSPTASLCPDTKTISITVNPEPKIEVRSDYEKGCVPLNIVLSTETEQGELVWNFGDDTDNKAGLSTKHTYETAGIYHVNYVYTDNKTRCQSRGELDKFIRVFEAPFADFSAPEVVSVANPEVQLINTSSNLVTNKYQWTIPNAVTGQDEISTELNPTITLPNLGYYQITLTASSLNGCKSEVKKLIVVKNEFNVYIPNVFTPNNDGTNDIFMPVFSPFGLDYKTYNFQIFDRWGTLIFQSSDPAQGWDGSVQNRGEESIKHNFYIYKLRFKDTDGKSYEKTGEVQLLR